MVRVVGLEARHLSKRDFESAMSTAAYAETAALLSAQVTGLYVDETSFRREWRVLRQVRAPDPGSRRITAVLVLEEAVYHKDFLSSPMPVRFEARTRRPPDKGNVLAVEGVKGKHR